MKSSSIILATASLLLCASSVEMFKFGKSAPPPPPPPPPSPPSPPTPPLAEQVDYAQAMYLAPTRYYPMPAELLRQPLMAEPQYAPPAMKGFEFHASKSFGKSYAPAAPVAPLLAQPQPLAYLVVRPIPSALRPQLESHYPQQQQPADTKGGRPLAVQEQAAPQYEQQQYAAYYQPQAVKTSSYGGVKGGRQSEEQAEQQIQQIEQQHEQITEEQQQQQPQLQQQQPALIVPVAPGKEGKLRAMLDKLMSKLTLGSSYQVVSEEIVVPPPQQQQLPAATPIQQQQIEQQQQQQLTVEDQRLEQQLEQQRDNGFEEGATKQVKSPQLPITQEQVKEEPVVQLQQSALAKGQQQQQQQQEIFRQEPLEAAPAKGIKQQLPTISQEPLRQEAKGTY